jgi:hypothetical protein
MSAQHTPAEFLAPWTAESAKDFSPGRHDDKRWVVKCGNGLPLIAVVEQYRGQAAGIARLIASAPDLLAALEESERLLANITQLSQPNHSVMIGDLVRCADVAAKQARAAIERATGGGK